MHACSVESDFLHLHGLKPTRLICPWDYPGKNTAVGCHFLLPGDLPNPGIKPSSPALAGRFFTNEPPGKPYSQVYALRHVPTNKSGAWATQRNC